MKTEAAEVSSLRYLSIRDILKQEISGKRLVPGYKLASERDLSRRFGVSRWTVIEALKLLEHEGWIEKIPYRGIFVKSPSDRLKKRKLLFLLPHDRIDERSMGFVEWNRYTELSAGVLEGARVNGLELAMIPRDQIKELVNAANDTLAVVVYFKPEDDLVACLNKSGINCIITGPNSIMPGFSSVLYGREAAIADTADHIIKNYRSAGFICPALDQAERTAKIKMMAELGGVATSSKWVIPVECNDLNGIYRILKERLPEDPGQLPEIIYCDRMIYPLALMRLVYERNWRLGRDLNIMAFTCRTAIQSICPDLVYTRIPYYEMGIETCNMAMKLGAGDGQPQHIRVPAEIISNVTGFSEEEINSDS